MRPLTDSLDSEQVGVSIARCEPGWQNKSHDHAAEDHEEIYVLLEGEATVVIDDESVELEAGDAVWIPPTATRQIQNGDVESALVLVSARRRSVEPRRVSTTQDRGPPTDLSGDRGSRPFKMK
ncbi:cupin domain-containing protein [Halorubrum ezzemoulense]|uniref:cupin domain-containing protein n=1 Tax=Halorubrum ezzemoulense TaxID=337243 RepID=UPI0026E50F82